MSIEAELVKCLYSGFVDNQDISQEQYRPKLLVNDYEKGQKVLTSIIKELNNCDEFFFSIAFITQSGVTTLLNTLKELEDRNINGKIVASQYLNFTDPRALEKLLRFKNIDLRMHVNGNLHSKGYIFRRQESYSLIVGSSNLTQEALSSNKEWNIKVSSMAKGSLIQETMNEFEQTFLMAEAIDQRWIDEYNLIYQRSKLSRYSSNGSDPLNYGIRENECQNYHVDFESSSKREYSNGQNSSNSINIFQLHQIMPNKMQINALLGIEKVRQQGGIKALLISATGTGKTYLAAFDVRKVLPRRFLFLVHREQILDQAMGSFKNVLGHHIEIGKLCGNYKQTDVQYLFSTVQTMSKDNVLTGFQPDTFDYIVIDESHRAGADSYQKIIKYFEPGFLLGMTATPERTDAYNICADFDYNIAYEIRLQQAMQEDMLCPFHYFGVTEMTINGQIVQDNTEFKYLVSKERVRNIIEKIQFYGYYGERVKGLMFCSNNEEARALSLLFNEMNYHTLALSGSDSQEKRDEAVKKLEQDNVEGSLDYIFTVDIFNEGVDIPSVNQVIMLRPTKSAIIFVQQLGRGIRKAYNKDFVVVLDFIGNYQNNFMIPIALSGDRSFNKDTIRRYVSEGSRVIPGCSTINFDAISKNRIFASIDNSNFNSIKLINESYQNLKYRLGRIPKLIDFEEHDSLDVARIFENGSLGSYYKFLVKYEKDYSIRLDNTKVKYIEFISKKLAPGKRVHELIILKSILNGEKDLLGELQASLVKEYHLVLKDTTITNVVNVLTNEFPSGTGKTTYEECIFIESVGPTYVASKAFLTALKDKFFNDMVRELIEFGFYRNKTYYGQTYLSTSFQLYQKYSYEDVCRLLEWEHNEVAQNIGGYKYDAKSKTYPVFINYEKSEEIVASINYEDRFVSPSVLIALSKSNRRPDSKDVVTAYKANELGVSMELFVRKNKDDKISKEFYYLGRIRAVGEPHPIVMKGAGNKAVEITYQLDTAVREDVYEYLIEE